MDSGIRQPSQAMMRAAWDAADAAAVVAAQGAPDVDRVLQLCQAIIRELPGAQQRHVVNALALARGRTRGTANDVADTGTRGAATDPAPSDAERETRGAASDPARNPDSGTVAAAWDLP